jgi:uncharacterized membrane protein (Fun14 family)
MADDATTRRIAAVDDEIRELERSIGATRTHGFLYYGLLVVIVFVGFAIGYATHTLVGAVLILVGLGIVAYREVGHYRHRVAAIETLIAEKRREREAIERGSVEEDPREG